jgi:hypothetical protein
MGAMPKNVRKSLPFSRFGHGSHFTDFTQYAPVTPFSLQQTGTGREPFDTGVYAVCVPFPGINELAAAESLRNELDNLPANVRDDVIRSLRDRANEHGIEFVMPHALRSLLADE